MSVDVVVGLQRGDEGKGRFVDILAEKNDIVARFNGGNNAGHTVVLPDGRSLKLHLVPSGVAHPNTVNIIGNGTLVDAVKLVAEIKDIESKGITVSPKNLLLSSAAHLILPHHLYEDAIREAGPGRQGTTKTGIAPVAAAKAMRSGVRVEMIQDNPDELLSLVRDKLAAQREQRQAAGLDPINEEAIAQEYVACAKQLQTYIADTVVYLNDKLRAAKPSRVLAEGAQAFLLDIDHGMYPYTTSTTTTSGGVATGLGIPPYFVTHVTGVVKAVQSHVGDGPFVTEVSYPQVAELLHGDKSTIDAEVGTTTGRTRRLGYLDLPQIRRALLVNGIQAIALSKLDWVPRYGEAVQICTAYTLHGKTLSVAPDAALRLEQCAPVYESLPTWHEDIQGIRDFKELPANAQKYIEFLEDQLGVPITMIGVGPRRDQLIIR